MGDAMRRELVCQLRLVPHIGGADRGEISRVADEKRPVSANPVMEGNWAGCSVRFDVRDGVAKKECDAALLSSFAPEWDRAAATFSDNVTQLVKSYIIRISF